MKEEDRLLKDITDKEVYYLLDKYCNDDIKKLQIVDEMITVLNRENYS